MRSVFLVAVMALVGLAGCLDNQTETPQTDDVPDMDRTGWGTPTLIQESTGREMSLAVDPNDPDRLLACAPTGTGVVGPSTNGPNHSDFWLSTDGGGNWTLLLVEAGAEGTDLRTLTNEGGDCDVAISPDGTLWTVDSWLGSLAVSWSSDGQSWQGNGASALVPVSDRPWIRFDAEGVLHMTYQDVQFGMPSAIWYTSTTDGATWTVPTSVATATPDGAFTWTGDFVVSDDGVHLWSIYTRRQGPTATDLEASGAEQVWIAHSGNSGLTWSSSLLSQRDGPSSFLYPSLDADAAGGLHAVWSEYRGADQPTFYAYAPDASTWSEPVALQEGLRTGAPWVAGAGPGQAKVLWSGTGDQSQPADQQRWWLTVAHVDNAAAVMGNTTSEPLWIGAQNAFPEFNEIQMDSLGRTHVAAVAPCVPEGSDFTAWCPYHQVLPAPEA